MKKVISMYLVMLMLIGAISFVPVIEQTVKAAGFTDVASDYSYAEAVNTLSRLSVMKGYEDGSFNPDFEITRAEFSAIIVRVLGLENEAKDSMYETEFSDVTKDHWACGYINVATNYNIINGYGDGFFGPADPVTYEQAIKMIVSALNYQSEAELEGGYPSGYLLVAARKGIDKGVDVKTDTLVTTYLANRSEVAQMVYNSLNITSNSISGKTFMELINEANHATGDKTPEATPEPTRAPVQSSSDDYFTNVENATSKAIAVEPLKKNEFIHTPRNNKNETWYKVDLREGEGLTVAIQPQIDKSSMNIYIYNESSGSPIASKIIIANGKYGVIDYKSPSNQTIYVKVIGEIGMYNLGFYDSYFNNTSSLNDNRDFFGSLNTAKEIISDFVTREDSNLEDWYRVDMKEGQTLTIDISPQIDKGSMNIYMYNESGGSSIASKIIIANGKTGTISKKVAKDGTYFIKVTGATGKYKLNYSIN